MKMEELIKLIQEWSANKGLHEADSRGQFLKVIEEAGEIAESRVGGVGLDLEERFEMLKDAIGDTYVTLIILAQQNGVDFLELWSESDSMVIPRKDDQIEYLLLYLSEVAGKMARGKANEIDKPLMKIIPVLRGMAIAHNTTSHECLKTAYNVIAKRKGEMVNGVFVKSEDL